MVSPDPGYLRRYRAAGPVPCLLEGYTHNVADLDDPHRGLEYHSSEYLPFIIFEEWFLILDRNVPKGSMPSPRGDICIDKIFLRNLTEVMPSGKEPSR